MYKIALSGAAAAADGVNLSINIDLGNITSHHSDIEKMVEVIERRIKGNGSATRSSNGCIHLGLHLRVSSHFSHHDDHSLPS